jgi:FixJ family two-component response regulator
LEVPKSSIVHVVDNDEAVRDSTRVLLESHGLEVRTYASAQAFLLASPTQCNACLLLDLHMPGMSGLELLETLQSRGFQSPVVAITGCGNSLSRQRAVRAGAVALLDKPASAQMLLDSLAEALAQGTLPARLRKST